MAGGWWRVGRSTGLSFHSLSWPSLREGPDHALGSERRKRENPSRLLIDQALAPLGTVAAASQGLSLRRSR